MMSVALPAVALPLKSVKPPGAGPPALLSLPPLVVIVALPAVDPALNSVCPPLAAPRRVAPWLVIVALPAVVPLLKIICAPFPPRAAGRDAQAAVVDVDATRRSRVEIGELDQAASRGAVRGTVGGERSTAGIGRSRNSSLPPRPRWWRSGKAAPLIMSTPALTEVEPV